MENYLDYIRLLALIPSIILMVKMCQHETGFTKSGKDFVKLIVVGLVATAVIAFVASSISVAVTRYLDAKYMGSSYDPVKMEELAEKTPFITGIFYSFVVPIFTTLALILFTWKKESFKNAFMGMYLSYGFAVGAAIIGVFSYILILFTLSRMDTIVGVTSTQPTTLTIILNFVTSIAYTFIDFTIYGYLLGLAKVSKKSITRLCITLIFVIMFVPTLVSNLLTTKTAVYDIVCLLLIVIIEVIAIINIKRIPRIEQES